MKVTSGIVVSTVGPGNNSSLFQLDAATNPGNSGGPVLDDSGNLVGVLVGGFPDAEGFTFAIKAATAMSFMDSLGVAYATSVSGNGVNIDKLYQRARRFVVLITCK